jgi:mannose-6-phosphate isomerase-like protein (cupin superfamily)
VRGWPLVVMAASGDTLGFVDGSEFRITKAAADTDGGYLEMEWSLPPSTETPPKHIHPQQREDYEVLEGAFDVFVGDGWRTLGAGESASVPAGEVHTFRVGDQPVRVRNVHAPALDFEDYFATESALMAAQKIRSYSSPRAALHYAVLLDRYRHCMIMANPLLRGLVSVLAPLARRLGFGSLRAGS